MGWLRYYSDNPEGALIFLENAAWIDRTNNHAKIPVKGPGVLLTGKPRSSTSDFLTLNTPISPSLPPARHSFEKIAPDVSPGFTRAKLR